MFKGGVPLKSRLGYHDQNHNRLDCQDLYCQDPIYQSESWWRQDSVIFILPLSAKLSQHFIITWGRISAAISSKFGSNLRHHFIMIRVGNLPHHSIMIRGRISKSLINQVKVQVEIRVLAINRRLDLRSVPWQSKSGWYHIWHEDWSQRLWKGCVCQGPIIKWWKKDKKTVLMTQRQRSSVRIFQILEAVLPR